MKPFNIFPPGVKFGLGQADGSPRHESATALFWDESPGRKHNITCVTSPKEIAMLRDGSLLREAAGPLKDQRWHINPAERFNRAPVVKGTRAVNLTVPVKPLMDDDYPPALVENGHVVAWSWAKGGKS